MADIFGKTLRKIVAHLFKLIFNWNYFWNSWYFVIHSCKVFEIIIFMKLTTTKFFPYFIETLTFVCVSVGKNSGKAERRPKKISGNSVVAV